MSWLLLSLAFAAPIDQAGAPILKADASDVVTMTHLSYVLREPVYDDFLLGKKNLASCEAKYKESADRCLLFTSRVEETLTLTETQMDEDEHLINSMKDSVWRLELKLERAKNQRNNAVLVAGSLVLGNCAVIAASVALR